MILVPATVHGRVLIDHDGDAAVASSGALVGFHGYGQSAGDLLDELRRIPGADRWTRVSVQALNRFYTRGDAKVVASWMTREDRDQVIADNVAYVDSAITQALQQVSTPVPQHPSAPALVLAGFSQGVAMAYRAALLGNRPVTGLIALAGDIPPELKTEAATRHRWPKVLLGVGTAEQWYSGEKIEADLQFLTARGVDHTVVRFEGGHEWTEEFRVAAGKFLLTC